MSTAAHRRWGLLAAGLVGAACSLALDFGEDIPCSVDADCMYASGQGTCEEGICQPPGTATADTDDTSADDDNGSNDTPSSDTSPTTDPDTGTDPTETTSTPTECTLNSECEDDQRCAPNGICVDLLTAECHNVRWPDSGRDNVVFLGSIMPTGEPFTALVQPLENAVQLAVDDFNETTGLQGDRDIAWVRCNDAGGTATSVAAAEHLVGTVRVPAIVGPIFSESVLAVSDVTIPEGVFLISPTASAEAITTLDDDNLVWRTIPSDVYQINALNDRLVDLDAGAGDVSSVLVLAKDDAYGNGILPDVVAAIQTELPGAELYSATYPNPTTFATMEDLLMAYGSVLAGAAADPAADPYYSHVVFIGTSEIQALLYAFLGVVWQPTEGDPMPLFTVTHGAVPEMERFINEIGEDKTTEPLVPLKPLIEANLQGTSPIVLNQENFFAFTIRYNIAFNGQEPLSSSALSYDATLATLFAACTVAADDDVSGAAIAAAMPRLFDPDGDLISFSGADISFIEDARNALVVDGGSVDLQGVSGELQWDAETGDVRANVWGWVICDPTPDGTAPSANPAREYMLDDEPATDGMWVDYPDPCK
jgi:branched-chain amino acid transport system substrate-binding protein